jgi:peptidoglycan/LPS O-acetylase OafA/YrhL
MPEEGAAKATLPRQARPAGPGRLPGVEGLRAVAALSILVFHVWKYSSPSGPVDLGYASRFALPHLAVGVTLFFTLSGYLLYRPIVGSLLATGELPAVRRYLRNRALRILPAYWVVLGVTAIVLPAALVRQSASELVLGRLTDKPGLLVSNALFAQNYLVYSLDTGLGPAWSLAVEVVFYLTLPLLALLALVVFRRAGSPRGQCFALLLPAGLLLLLGTVGRAATVWVLPPGEWGNPILVRSFLTNCDLFAPGMALAVLHILILRGWFRLPRLWPLGVCAALVVTVLLTVVLTDREIIWQWGVLNPYQRLTSFACLLLLALVVLPNSSSRNAPIQVRLLESRPLVLIGLASYSLFLWHEPIIRLLTHEGLTAAGGGGFVLNLVMFGVIGGVLAAMTYRFVERPALARKATRASPPVTPPPAVEEVPSPTAARTPTG